MKILVIGSGGREHALVWKIAQSPLVTKIYCAPGNPGIGQLAVNVPLKVDDLDGLLTFANRVVGVVELASMARVTAPGPVPTSSSRSLGPTRPEPHSNASRQPRTKVTMMTK